MALLVFSFLFLIFFFSLGTATQLYASLAPTIVSGEYYADCKVENHVIHAKAKDDQLARDLWHISCELTNITQT